MMSARAADSTPGTPSARSSTSCHAERMRPGFAREAGDSARRAVSTSCAFTPGLSDERARSERPSMPAETKSTTARATSATTHALCREPEQGAAHEGDGEREQPDGGVEPDLARTRQAPRPRHDERAHAEHGEEGTQGSAGQAQDRAFRPALTDETASARTERRTHAELVLARRGARQQQARDVHAGQEQHQADGAE